MHPLLVHAVEVALVPQLHENRAVGINISGRLVVESSRQTREPSRATDLVTRSES
jgi:hypothetical protein